MNSKDISNLTLKEEKNIKFTFLVIWFCFMVGLPTYHKMWLGFPNKDYCEVSHFKLVESM